MIRRKPTRWATSEAVADALRDMKPEHIQCRATRHWLQIDPKSLRYDASGNVVVTLKCARCEDYSKTITYTTMGQVVDRSSPRYTGGYVLKDVGRMGGDVQGLLLDRFLQDLLKTEMDEQKPKPKRKRRNS